ncbi:MAG: FHA domain-containing protein [Cellulomonas sp.]|nr:FHA domain-containing protein [Cellulomonas sp.]MCR6647878.1 FHA domain-containing protein [Cellulomonas sp.]
MSVPEYLPGDWSAVSRPGFVALLGPSAGPATARALWEASADGLLAGLVVLARNGFGGLPSFALVHVERGRAHLALRGDVTAEVGTPQGPRTVRAGEIGTWSEQVFDDVTWVRLRSDDAPGEGDGLPLGDGVAAASALRVVLVEGSDVVAPDGPVAAEAAPDESAPDLVAPAPDGETAAADLGAPAAEVIDVPELALAPTGDDASVLEAPAIDDPAVDEPVQDGPVHDEPVHDEPVHDEPVRDEPVRDEPVADAPFADVEPVRDELAEHAVVASGSAPEQGLPEQGLPERGLPEQGLPEPALPELLVPEPVRPEPARADEVEAEPVPALVALGAPEADVESTVDGVRTLVGPASPDDHDGLTILSSDLAQIRDQLPAWASQWPQEGQTPGPFEVPTPVPAPEPPRLLLSTGTEVSLDRTVLLGRAPQVARVTNRELPRLVAVPSPQQDISRTHAEVRAEGEHVLVTDLHSTNGVHVSRQGEGARRLHPGEPSVVVPGELVDLGDGVTFTVDAGGR